MSIKPRVKVTSSQRQRNGQIILNGAKPQIRRDAKRLGEMMVEEGTNFIKQGFVTDRPSHRRRDNSIRLVNSLKYEVAEVGDVVSAVLTIKSGASAVKVATLNNGSRPHDITPRNSRLLVFPGNRGTISGSGAQLQIGTRRRTGPNAYQNAYSSDRSARAKRVSHPGRSRTARGTKFMQRARARAIARLR